jgi:hypothetical protein
MLKQVPIRSLLLPFTIITLTWDPLVTQFTTRCNMQNLLLGVGTQWWP